MGKLFERFELNKSKLDLILKRQLKKQTENYELGESSYASFSRGSANKSLCSGVLLERHKRHGNANLVAISDVSNITYMYFWDRETSNYILMELSKWFNGLSKDEINNPDILKKKVRIFLNELNYKLKSNHSLPVSSLAYIIASDDKTLLVTVGDIFIYLKKDGKVFEPVNNDSLLSKMIREGKKPQSEKLKEDISLVSLNNLGIEEFKAPNIEVIDNDYDLIALTTMTIIKNLPEDQLQTLLMEYSAESIPELLIKLSYNIYSSKDYSEHSIIPGQDDLVAATYKRKKKRGK